MGFRDRLRDRVFSGLGGQLHSAPAPAPQAHSAPSARSDADNEPLSHMDSLINALTGLGGVDDKGSASRPNLSQIPLSDSELSQSWTANGIARRLVSIYPDEACRKGWRVVDGSSEVDPMADFDRRLNLREQLRQGMTWAALYGHAVGLIVTQGGGTNLEAPLRVKRVREIKQIHIFDALEATPLRWDSDPKSPTFREPLIWNVTSHSNVVANFKVHRSRTILFRGAVRPPSQVLRRHSNMGIDDSWLNVWWTQIAALLSTMQGGALMAMELRESIVKIAGMKSVATSDQRSAFETRLRIMAKAKGLLGLILLSEGDEYRTQLNTPTGFKELSSEARMVLSAATGIPHTKFYGDSPSGLSTDDKAGSENFDRIVGDWFARMKPELRKLYELEYAIRGGAPDRWRIEHNPLHEESRKEKAEVEKLHAEKDAIYIASKVAAPSQVQRSRLSEKGWQDDLLVAEGDEVAPTQAPTMGPEGTLPFDGEE